MNNVNRKKTHTVAPKYNIKEKTKLEHAYRRQMGIRFVCVVFFFLYRCSIREYAKTHEIEPNQNRHKVRMKMRQNPTTKILLIKLVY